MTPFDKTLIDENNVVLEDDYTMSTARPGVLYCTNRTTDPVPMLDFPVYVTFKCISFKEGYITVGLAEKKHDLRTYLGDQRNGWGFDVCGEMYHGKFQNF